jgi:hypothetical protein
MFLRIQSYVPQGIANERYPPPIHLSLGSDEKFPRCIHISIHTESLAEATVQDATASRDSPPEALSSNLKRPLASDSTTPLSKHPCLSKTVLPAADDTEAFNSSPLNSVTEDGHCDVNDTVIGQDVHTKENDGTKASGSSCRKTSPSNITSTIPHWPTDQDPCWPLDAPRILLGVRLTDNIRYANLSPDAWVEWLRTMPGVAGIESVHIEAAFKCNSTLLLVSLPMAVWTYLPDHPAIIPLGQVHSSNLIAAKGVSQEKVGAVDETMEKEIISKNSPNEQVESYTCLVCCPPRDVGQI